PLIFKRAIDIDPLVTVVATALGGALFGIIGVLLAVPAASILQTLVIKVIAPAIREHNA
ncbi:MAG: AI-2E family transporter, partial [Candidatus Eremiobacteraeota bacterium]|nr:AI-2E family transporter [Candidatus Eremiobacteraeota bacterium]